MKVLIAMLSACAVMSCKTARSESDVKAKDDDRVTYNINRMGVATSDPALLQAILYSGLKDQAAKPEFKSQIKQISNGFRFSAPSGDTVECTNQSNAFKCEISAAEFTNETYINETKKPIQVVLHRILDDRLKGITKGGGVTASKKDYKGYNSPLVAVASDNTILICDLFVNRNRLDRGTNSYACYIREWRDRVYNPSFE